MNNNIISIMFFSIIMMGIANHATCEKVGDSPLQIFAFWEGAKYEDGVVTRTVRCLIKNRSDSMIRVARNKSRGIDGVRCMASESRQKLERISHGITWAIDGGVKLIPSESELDIVELRPGELTQFFAFGMMGRDTRLEDAIFVYYVDKELGSRFNVWSGILKVGIVRRY